MARTSDPHSATAQFFINGGQRLSRSPQSDQPGLGLLRVRTGCGRHGCGRCDRRRADHQSAWSPKRATEDITITKVEVVGE